jgi:hypothetical protein
MPVSGNTLHHAAEQMMKAALAHEDSLEEIKMETFLRTLTTSLRDSTGLS